MLFVRFEDPARPRPMTELVASPRDLQLVRLQHRLFYLLVLAAPVEWWWRGRPAGWGQLVGALVLVAGVVGYRRAGGLLGDQLSPLVAPREPARLVERGVYRRLRHPMYLAELVAAAGAAATLAARVAAVLGVAFAAVVLRRIHIEEHVLAARLPEYRAYAARTYRLIPYVY